MSFLDGHLSDKDVIEVLERAGVEVEDVIKVGEEFENILPARVLRVERVGKLNWVEVDVKGVRKTVATTDDVRQGEILLWADLPPKEMGGKLSEGMFLSEEELGLVPKSEHLARVEDPDRYKEEFLLGETVLQLYITPNRPDLLSVRGLAIEVSAFTGLPFVDIEIHGKPTLDETFPVEVSDERCDIYTLRLIKLGKGETPKRVRYALHLVGFNAINPAVDATNWVAYVLGQPLHAFDSRKVEGKIVVRPSIEGEKFVSLDGTEYTLSEGIMLIADEVKPLAIAGVIGGSESGTYEDTETVYLESAHFDPTAIRKASTTLKIFTESSRRFERNVSPRLVLKGSLYAANLLREWVGAEYGEVNVKGNVQEPRKVFLSFKKLKKYIGFVPENLNDILQKLRFVVESSSDDGVTVIEPEHRTDVSLQEDVIEEIARLIGYDNLPLYLPAETPLPPRPRDRYEDEVRTYLASIGAYEVVSLGLFSKKEVEGMEGLKVLSDFNESFSFLSSSPLPHILKPLSYNHRIGNQATPLFSLVNLYDRDGREERFIVFGIASPAEYADAKFFLDSSIKRFGWRLKFKLPSEDPALHPNLSADIIHEGKRVGAVGAVKHRVAKRFGLKTRVFAWYLSLLPKSTTSYKRPSTLPASVKDISFLAPLDALFQEIDEYIEGIVKDLPIEDFKLLDIYEGKAVPPGYRSYTYRFILRPEESEEVKDILQKLIERIEKRYTLRR